MSTLSSTLDEVAMKEAIEAQQDVLEMEMCLEAIKINTRNARPSKGELAAIKIASIGISSRASRLYSWAGTEMQRRVVENLKRAYMKPHLIQHSTEKES